MTLNGVMAVTLRYFTDFGTCVPSHNRVDVAVRAKIDKKMAISLQRGQSDAKFQVDGEVPHQSFLHRYLGK